MRDKPEVAERLLDEVMCQGENAVDEVWRLVNVPHASTGVRQRHPSRSGGPMSSVGFAWTLRLQVTTRAQAIDRALRAGLGVG